MSQYTTLTPEEKKVVTQLKRLASKWSKSLWLYSASGSLCVMKKNVDGEKAVTTIVIGDGDQYDQEYLVEIINGIDNDGGDW